MTFAMRDHELETLSLGACIWHVLILYITILFCVIGCRHIREILFCVCLPGSLGYKAYIC
jgi:hypothetical protein